MRTTSGLALVVALVSLPACNLHKEQHDHEHEEQQKIVTTTPLVEDIVTTQQYVCQIRSQRYISVKALEPGYLEPITVKEGQAVKQGDVLFTVIPVLYRTRYEAEKAEFQYAQLEYDYSLRLSEDKHRVISPNEVALYKAKLAKARAKMEQADAELNFTKVVASFDGFIDRLYEMQGSLIKEGDVLTTLSDNSVMWVYFNVPEARYFEFMARQGKRADYSRLELVDSRIELKLADGNIFRQNSGNTVTVEGTFNNETGNIQFRSDFPNPDRLLRHGQTGTILIHHTDKKAMVIPQRATFELLDKRYVWVIGPDHIAHQRQIVVQNELEDIFIIKSGLKPDDKIVLEGVRQVHENDKVEYEFRKPEEALEYQKFRAE